MTIRLDPVYHDAFARLSVLVGLSCKKLRTEWKRKTACHSRGKGKKRNSAAWQRLQAVKAWTAKGLERERTRS